MANYDGITRYLGSIDQFSSLNNVDSVDGKYEVLINILHHSIEYPTRRITSKTDNFSPRLRRLPEKRVKPCAQVNNNE